MYVSLHGKSALFLSDFNETRIFSTDFRKKYLDIKFRGNPLVGAEMFHMETDSHEEVNIRSSQIFDSAFKKTYIGRKYSKEYLLTHLLTY